MSKHIRQNKTIYDKEAKIWSGSKAKPKYNSDCSVGKVALEALLKDPKHIAQICYHNGKQYTNLEIANFSIGVAQHFRKLQLKQCEVIGICAGNSDYLAPLYFGAMLAGLTVSTLDPSFDKDGIKQIFSITKPLVMFCDGAVYKNVKEVLDEIDLQTPIYTMKDHIEGVAEITEFLEETHPDAIFEAEPLKLGAAQTAAILCSSGTTGLPKGVCMSHESLLNANIFQSSPEDMLLSFSTLYWLSGLITLIYGTIQGATRIITDKGFSPENFFDIIQKYKVSLCITPPSQIALSVTSPNIKDYDLSSLKTYFCGGSAVPTLLVQKLQHFMPNAVFMTGYGMSEVCCAIATGEAKVDGSIGQLSDNMQVKIIDDDDEQLGPNEVGEICLSTPYSWAGYYGNAAATAAIYIDNKWAHSGDMGYVDDNGTLFVVDRKKDILKYNNFHFFPTEIETVIYELPGVAEVCVCGIADIVSTHLPAAAIKKTPDSTLTEEDVYQHVANKMAHFKHLRGGVYFFEELPKTASGKNLRRDVTTICEQLWNANKHRHNIQQQKELAA